MQCEHWQHSAEVVSAVSSQEVDPGFDSSLALFCIEVACSPFVSVGSLQGLQPPSQRHAETWGWVNVYCIGVNVLTLIFLFWSGAIPCDRLVTTSCPVAVGIGFTGSILYEQKKMEVYLRKDRRRQVLWVTEKSNTITDVANVTQQHCKFTYTVLKVKIKLSNSKMTKTESSFLPSRLQRQAGLLVNCNLTLAGNFYMSFFFF